MSYSFFTALDGFDEENLKNLNDTLINMMSDQSMVNNTDITFDVTFGTAGTDLALTHNNNSVLANFLVVNINAPGVVYASPTTNTINTTYLRCNVTGAKATIKLF